MQIPGRGWDKINHAYVYGGIDLLKETVVKVITYIGDAKSVEEASVKLVKKAAELIDLTKHEGEHPRMGS